VGLIPFVVLRYDTGLKLLQDDRVIKVLRKLEISKGMAGKLVLAGIVQAYFLAWMGHFFVEKNRPATFKVSGESVACPPQI
jgi:hypothetical protein